MHVFEYENINGEFVLQDEVFKQVKPGLSAYKDDPQQGSLILTNLCIFVKFSSLIFNIITSVSENCVDNFV